MPGGRSKLTVALVAAALVSGCACEQHWREWDRFVSYAGAAAESGCEAPDAGLWSDQSAELAERASPALIASARREAEAACAASRAAARRKAEAKTRHWREEYEPSGLHNQLK